jgi:hypothetical protein
MNARIGPKMWDAYNYVRSHPDCTKCQVSVAIGPNGSNYYGWRCVDRAIKAGLIKAIKSGNKYQLRALPVVTR